MSPILIVSIDKTCPRWVEFATDYISRVCDCPPESMIFTEIYASINNAKNPTDLYRVYADLIDNPFQDKSAGLIPRYHNWCIELYKRWNIFKLRISDNLIRVIEI